MSTVAVLNLPEYGHMNATFPLVAELVARGERVVYYATEQFRAPVEAAGAEFAGYGNDAAFEPPAHTGGLYSVMAYLMGLAEDVLPGLLQQLRDDPPDYLLIDSVCVWGTLAQQILKIPAIALASVFVPNPALVSMEEMVDQAYGHAPKEVLLAGIDALNTYLKVSQRIDRRFGTRSPNIVEFFGGQQPLNVLFTSRYFHPMGQRYDESYQFAGPSMEARNHEGDLPLTLPEGDDPLIFISLGTIFGDRPEFYRACFEAFGNGAYRVVVAIGSRVDREALGAAPSKFIVREFVPQLQVLEHAALFLTHGGMNSTSEALWHGVPLLVYPQHGDQHLVAARVSELGAGLRVSPGDIEPARLRELTDRVLGETIFRRQARKIAETFHAAGGCRRAADEILAYSRNVTPEVMACPQSA